MKFFLSFPDEFFEHVGQQITEKELESMSESVKFFEGGYLTLSQRSAHVSRRENITPQY